MLISVHSYSYMSCCLVNMYAQLCSKNNLIWFVFLGFYFCYQFFFILIPEKETSSLVLPDSSYGRFLWLTNELWALILAYITHLNALCTSFALLLCIKLGSFSTVYWLSERMNYSLLQTGNFDSFFLHLKLKWIEVSKCSEK